MSIEDEYIDDPKYCIVYCNVLDNRIEFMVLEINEFQKEIPTLINGKTVTFIKVS